MVNIDGKVYIICNSENNKVYIGQTTSSIEERFKQHKKLCKSNSGQLIYKAMKKYGVDKFYIKELEDGISTFEELNEKESYYIKKYNSIAPNGYNLCPGGNLWRKMPTLAEEEQLQVIELYLDGRSQRSIGEQFGVCHNVIQKVLKKHSVETRKRCCNLPDRTSAIKEKDLYRMYVVEKMLVKDIAEYYGVNVRTVNRAKNRYNLKRI